MMVPLFFNQKANFFSCAFSITMAYGFVKLRKIYSNCQNTTFSDEKRTDILLI